LKQQEVYELYNNPTTTEQTQYSINFPEETEVQLLLFDDLKYIETTPFIFSGIANIHVGVPSVFDTTTQTTNSTAYNSGIISTITGASITYNNPIVILKYRYFTPIIKTSTNIIFLTDI